MAINLKMYNKVLPNFSRTLIRRMSSSGDGLIKVSINEDSGFATVSMCRPPVNSLDVNLLTSLSSTFSNLERDKCKGLILTSDLSSVFCAGLDISQIYKPDFERFKVFWAAFQEAWLNLYLSSFPTVAAINGHSPAGGCVLALGCDYRIMVGPKYTIGLNESRVNVVAPPWLMDTMKNTIGFRQAELALTLGKLFSAEEALKVGLIDAVVPSKEEALEKAEQFLDAQSSVPSLARSVTKKAAREPSMRWLQENRQEDCTLFFDFIVKPQIQEYIGQYLSSIKKK